MKKVLSLFMVLLLAISLFACGKEVSKEPTAPTPATPEQVTPITPPETTVTPSETPITPSNPEIETKEDSKTGIQTQMVFYQEVYDILGAPDVHTTSPWSSVRMPMRAYYELDDNSILELTLQYGKRCLIYTTYQNGIGSGEIATRDLDVVIDFAYVTKQEYEKVKADPHSIIVDAAEWDQGMERFRATFIEYIE